MICMRLKCVVPFQLLSSSVGAGVGRDVGVLVEIDAFAFVFNAKLKNNCVDLDVDLQRFENRFGTSLEVCNVSRRPL